MIKVRFKIGDIVHRSTEFMSRSDLAFWISISFAAICARAAGLQRREILLEAVSLVGHHSGFFPLSVEPQRDCRLKTR